MAVTTTSAAGGNIIVEGTAQEIADALDSVPTHRIIAVFHNGTNYSLVHMA